MGRLSESSCLLSSQSIGDSVARFFEGGGRDLSGRSKRSTLLVKSLRSFLRFPSILLMRSRMRSALWLAVSMSSRSEEISLLLVARHSLLSVRVIKKANMVTPCRDYIGAWSPTHRWSKLP